MKRSNTLDICNYSNLAIYKQRVAYHEAGHAAAIHLNNRLKNLPPVFFKIELADLPSDAPNTVTSTMGSQRYIASVKGGRLIQTPLISSNTTYPQSSAPCDAAALQFADSYYQAFEADIVNLLVGSLAEAKFIALMDNEPFEADLFTVQALKNYGGDADLAVVYDYLHSYFPDPQAREGNLTYFLKQAFEFVDRYANWRAIERLANYILASSHPEISCEEVAEVLDRPKQDVMCAT